MVEAERKSSKYRIMDFTIPGNGDISGTGGGPVSHPKAVDARSEFALLQRNIPKEAQSEFG